MKVSPHITAIGQLLGRAGTVSHWLLAPFYAGLALSLLLLLSSFLRELWRAASRIFVFSAIDMLQAVLTLAIMALAAHLLWMIAMTGYRFFVGKAGVNAACESMPGISPLKLEIAIIIVLISALHLLKIYLHTARIPVSTLQASMLIHIVLVISAVLLACIDRITLRTGCESKPPGGE